MTTRLFVSYRGSVTLTDALADFGNVIADADATAILYSPQWCKLAAFMSGQLTAADGQRIDTSSVFEMRLFTPHAEMRWLNDPSPEQFHRAVILSENDCSGLLGQSWRATTQDCVESLEQTYLLWGEGTGRPMADGWSELATPRIGALLVPLAGVAPHQRVLLRSVEYLTEAEHGNVIVFEERLSGLEVVHD